MNLMKKLKHPVHIIADDGQRSPTALIPFCQVANNFSLFLEEKVNHYDVPYCHIFKPKIVGDQLCYEVNPNKYKDYMIESDEYSLRLFINYNEDRKIISNIDLNDKELEYSTETVPLIIGTIGKIRQN